MNTPPADYMAMINSSLGAPPAARPAGPPPPAPGPAPDFMAQVGSRLGAAPPAGPVIDNGAIAQGGFTVAPPPGAAPAPMGPPLAPPPPAAAPGPIPPNDAPPRDAGPSFLQRVHGAMNVTAPAHEVEMRGPQLKAAQDERNAAFAGAVQAVDERSQHTQAADMALALEEQRKAGIREDAANYSAAERANELAERQADFDASTKALSKASVDPGRYWANANIGVKIATLMSVALSGFVQGKRGGDNAGMNTIKMMMDDDIKAQEFAYNATKDTVAAKQTAFSMAMQKYQNADAARAATRAAALDYAASIANQRAVMWRGTEQGNHALEAAAQLTQDRANQIQQGVAFVPAKTATVGAQYVDPRTGITYDNKEAQGVAKTLDEHAFEERKQERGVAGQVIVEDAKAASAAHKDQRGLTVALPNGDTVVARDAAHAKELGDASASIHETNRLVNEAKALRSSPGFRIPGSPARAKLEQIQSELITGYSTQNKLGALSESDMKLAKNGTAQLTDFGPGPEAALDRLGETAQSRLRSQVRTIPDAPGTAKGELSEAAKASLTLHGKK